MFEAGGEITYETSGIKGRPHVLALALHGSRSPLELALAGNSTGTAGSGSDLEGSIVGSGSGRL